MTTNMQRIPVEAYLRRLREQVKSMREDLDAVRDLPSVDDLSGIGEDFLMIDKRLWQLDIEAKDALESLEKGAVDP